ncbi:MAG TPA: hypothetical protein VGN23_09805 [Verrucomicrobiae bacterium]|jgi:hypothetical protein
MSETIQWQGSKVEVWARLVPRYFWNTASIDVFVDGRQILKTDGQLKLKGTCSTSFAHANSTHVAILSWGCSGLRFSFPYELRIDGASVATSRVKIQNWPVVVIIIGVVWVVLSAAFAWIKSRH